VGAKVAVVVVEGGGPFGAAYARAAREANAPCDVVVVRGEPIRASGSSRVSGCVVMEGGRERKIKADAVLVDAPRAPAYELAEQAGAPLAHTPRGYVARADRGKIRDGVFLVGEAAGAAFEPEALLRGAEAIVRQLR
jgi:hypothetical protein